jgi:hypothetical protein
MDEWIDPYSRTNRVSHPELEPTLELLSDAFPDGLSQGDYWPLLATSSQHMSIRAMGATLHILGYGDYLRVINDFGGIDDQLGSTKTDVIQRMEEKLRPFGYDTWVRTDELS